MANPALARIYGYDSPADLQAHITDIATQLYVNPHRREEFIQALTTNGTVTNFESQVYRKDGQIIWISENARAVYDAKGRLTYFEGTVVDITDRKLSENTIHYQAFHDLLTGLPNRVLFDDRLAMPLAEARRQQQRVGVMFLDLDRFKIINDTHGHAVGDQLLQQVAERLVQCLQETDTVARWGGDEFTVLLPMVYTTPMIWPLWLNAFSTPSSRSSFWMATISTLRPVLALPSILITVNLPMCCCAMLTLPFIVPRKQAATRISSTPIVSMPLLRNFCTLKMICIRPLNAANSRFTISPN